MNLLLATEDVMTWPQFADNALGAFVVLFVIWIIFR